MTIDVRALLDAPHWPADRGLDTILGALLGRRDLPLPTQPPDPATLWPAASFGLDRVTSFRESSRQDEIVARCATERLAEAMFIEKLGLAFCAKMTLLATTAEERMLYSLIAADEATHYHWLSAFTREVASRSPFLDLLAEMIEQGSQASLTLLVQVVLEGWGVQHYRLLARDCAHPELTNVLRQIVIDETRHHGSGARLVANRQLVDQELIGILSRMLELVRCGPQAVVAALEPRDEVEATRCFVELGAEEESRRKLEMLRSLIEEGGAASVVRELEARGAFVPMTAAECARCSIS